MRGPGLCKAILQAGGAQVSEPLALCLFTEQPLGVGLPLAVSHNGCFVLVKCKGRP